MYPSKKKRDQLLKCLAKLSYPQKYETSEIAFGEITRVWADFALTKLRRHRDLLSNLSQEKLKIALSKTLSERCAPTLTALMRIAKNEGNLKGDAPRERYLSYITGILPKEAYLKELFFHFPPLASFIATHILLWVDQVQELLDRLNRDCSEIQSTFLFKAKRVEDLSVSLSDPHFGNRSVYRLIFDGGVSLIYKPKPLGLDKAYNRFVSELNHLGANPQLKTYRILDQKSYGWVEFIETLPCRTQAEVSRYFERFGMLMCLMFILEGTDCHFENVICSGEHPVLIDLESLFHPTLKTFKEQPELSVWSQSVFRTGFLPSFGVSAQRRIDISPLSAEEEQEAPQASARWQEINTDEMQFAFEKRTVTMAVPRPKIDGKIVSTVDYIEDLLRGFESMYRLFTSHKKKIASLLAPMFEHSVRCVFRPTALYFRFLQRLNDPLLMRSQAQVDDQLEILTRFSPVKGYRDLPKIVEREKEAILHGDIPFFLSSPKDCHLYEGNTIIAKNCFKRPARDAVLEKMRDLNEQDLKIQIEYIKNSLRFLTVKGDAQSDRYKPFRSRKVKLLSNKELIQFAEKIGDQVLALSQPLSDGSRSWITLELDPTLDRYVFQPISSHLYSGSAGIALFLGALGKISKKKIFSKVAENLLAKIETFFTEDPEAAVLVNGTGGMTGLGGAIYTFVAASIIFGKKKYLTAASRIASMIDRKKLEEDTRYDFVLGSAGFILALLALFQKTKESSHLKLAKEAGRFLMTKTSGPLLSGLSHGAAGIAYALFKLAKVSKEEEFKRAAEEVLQYERTLYSPEKGNWRDLRPGRENANPFSWCHGAPGIGLARLYTLQFYPDPKMKKELELALRATRSHLVSGVDHLCCGTFGRIAILWDAGALLKKKKWQEMALQETASQLEKFAKTGYFSLYLPFEEPIQSPSFMQGLSGIGYFLLRLTREGKNLPEILILE